MYKNQIDKVILFIWAKSRNRNWGLSCKEKGCRMGRFM